MTVACQQDQSRGKRQEHTSGQAVARHAGLCVICSKGSPLGQSPILLGPAKKVPTSTWEHWSTRVNRVCVRSPHTYDGSCCPIHKAGNLNSYEGQCLSLPCQSEGDTNQAQGYVGAGCTVQMGHFHHGRELSWVAPCWGEAVPPSLRGSDLFCSDDLPPSRAQNSQNSCDHRNFQTPINDSSWPLNTRVKVLHSLCSPKCHPDWESKFFSHSVPRLPWVPGVHAHQGRHKR